MFSSFVPQPNDDADAATTSEAAAIFKKDSLICDCLKRPQIFCPEFINRLKSDWEALVKSTTLCWHDPQNLTLSSILAKLFQSSLQQKERLTFLISFSMSWLILHNNPPSDGKSQMQLFFFSPFLSSRELC